MRFADHPAVSLSQREDHRRRRQAADLKQDEDEVTAMERLFRDARLGPFSPISNEMVRNFVGERLGLPRSY